MKYAYTLPENLRRREFAMSLFSYVFFSAAVSIFSVWVIDTYFWFHIVLFLIAIAVITIVDIGVFLPRKIMYTQIELTERNLIIRKGKSWRKVTYIPLERINTISFSQSLISKVYDHAKVVINAPTMRIDIPILSYSDARQLIKAVCNARENL